MIIRLCISLLFVFPLFHAFAYQSADTADYIHIMDLAYELEVSQPDSAIALYKQAYQLALNADDTLSAARCRQYTGIVFSEHDHPDSALYYYRLALPLFEKVDYPKGKGAINVNIGNVFQFRGWYDSAVVYYLKGVPYFESLKDTFNLIITYNNIGTVFTYIDLPEKSLTYYNTALDLSTQLADTGRIADTYINMSKVYLMMKKDTSETIDILKKVIQFSEPTQHHYLLMIAHNNLADLYLGYNEPQKALPHAQASLNYAQRVNMPFYTSSARLTFGRTYNMMGASAEALSHLKEALNLADAINSVELKSHALLLHAQAYEKQLDYKQAYQHLAQHLELYDSIFDLEQTRNINELERRYQAEKKTRELAEEQLLTAQQREKLQQQQSLLILALMLTLIFALAVGFLFYFLRQRRRRHAQQLIVLQRENELQSVRALITGEEKERTRIAKELHDGLSGLLASIRLRFGTFMDDLGPSGKGQAYEESLRLLEQASREVRQISHNLMPEILLRYGLVEALNSYFSNITQSGTLTIDFQVMGLEERLPSSFELTLYRILQELVNNIIKHSNASDVLIQISESDSLLSVTVEDNGVGFVPESASGGIGLDSIRSRVDYLSGKLDIQSEQGMGTSVYMEFVMDKKRISA